MENKTIGVWLVTSTVVTVVVSILADGNSNFDTLLGMCGIAFMVLAVIGGLRLQK